MKTQWYETTDGRRFHVVVGSQAEANLVANGAGKIAAPKKQIRKTAKRRKAKTE